MLCARGRSSVPEGVHFVVADLRLNKSLRCLKSASRYGVPRSKLPTVRSGTEEQTGARSAERHKDGVLGAGEWVVTVTHGALLSRDRLRPDAGPSRAPSHAGAPAPAAGRIGFRGRIAREARGGGTSRHPSLRPVGWRVEQRRVKAPKGRIAKEMGPRRPSGREGQKSPVFARTLAVLWQLLQPVRYKGLIRPNHLSFQDAENRFTPKLCERPRRPAPKCAQTISKSQ